MTDTLKRIIGPVALTTTAATVYTVPAATTTTVRHIHVSNESGTSANVTVSVGTDAAGKRFLFGVPIANASSGLDWTGSLVLAAGEVIQAYASAATSLTLIASGVETA